MYKYPSLVPPHKIVVVNCAGRTRSIIGTQSLVNAGFGGGEGEKEREGEKEGEGEVVGGVYACRNGTMGWCLEGLEVERGAERRCGEGGRGEDLEVCWGKEMGGGGGVNIKFIFCFVLFLFFFYFPLFFSLFYLLLPPSSLF